MKFEIQARDRASSARRGRLSTPHGVVDTPAFMPVGTRAAVRGLRPEEVEASGAQMILANTYHLYLRPGVEVIRSLDGLHRFMNWRGPILTDSGGYQIYSLAPHRRLEDDAVVFRSHLDGSLHRFTPEQSLEIQAGLGSDIVLTLDECPALPATSEELERAVERTTRWAALSREAWRGAGALFGIVQGGTDPELRRRSAREIVALGFDGHAIGGVSVGEDRNLATRITQFTAALLPQDKPRYLMGVGTPAEIIEAVWAGVDLFDCVLPTRNARNGMLFTRQGPLNIQRREFRTDPRPVEEGCECPTCRSYSRAYLRHLYQAREILAATLNTIHNLHFYQRLMRQLRAAIEAGALAELRRSLQEALAAAAPAVEEL
ncbi:MAG: tRNA guanosine(34) transglycosylase Tgt [Acidobacteriota bacterium]